LFLPSSQFGIEVKFKDSPKLTRSMCIAIEDLRLRELLVVYLGTREYSLAENVRALPLSQLCKEMDGA